MDKSEIKIPVMPKIFSPIKRDYPISPRENLLKAFRHEKPLWMPNFVTSGQLSPPGPNDDAPNIHSEDYTDWFGVFRKWSESQHSCTPVGTVFDSIYDWDKRITFPNLDALCWDKGADEFVRDENAALHTRFTGGIFQRLHALEGFENALVDMITEPEKCKEFFDIMADFVIDVFHRMHAVYRYDFVMYHDDWGTARGPFFSVELFKETLLEPTKRIYKAIEDAGVIPVSHNCGLVNDFIPYLVDEIGAQGLEIQPINDIKGILRTYGNRCTVEYTSPDPYFFNDPDTTEEQLKRRARETVETYGAHTNPGSGCVTAVFTVNEEMYRVFDEEVYRYSLERYRGL
jgi:hypothetical protein